ncbi:glycosyltransferase family 2 protein [Klebsiella quasipneumoniae]|nr:MULTISPECIES: glycosyltransferase [Enterobacteriaceae]HBR1529087.1 glycosyltransferase family 2 protein [Klebsiella quasipneumoniae subsp. quasipneumoniae]EHH4403761.1 glycosyltransferase family 2 protein [Escherichia coli]EIX8562848.1 glycosyltransferase family 2 protein [Escherichia coli]EJE7704755.1 glycosyltransferase family 2 protein [Escherichia coli]EKJ6175396.1 glycosyltransferase family 2 protein [Escherichia coli]
MKYYIAVPTYNGGKIWKEVITSIKKYAPQNLYVLVIDSNSKDDTAANALAAGFDVDTINGADFNHGGTRNIAVEKAQHEHDIIIFMTQDAIPQQDFIINIIDAFKDEKVACAYGRQLPHVDANPLASHARYYNYPTKDYVCGYEDIPEMGIKTVFMSNSFSAYRISAFEKLGGFPSNTILCEDMYFTAKAVKAGFKVAYTANAVVRHSHNYTPMEEFKRYFDIGVFHADEPWIREEFGGAGGEGKRFILSELKYLLKSAPLWIPLALINNFMKILGYKIGQNYKKLPLSIVKKLSMHKRYWE